MTKPACRILALAALALAVTGCRAGEGSSDLLPAVFGFGEGGVSTYAPGTLPVIAANEGDRLLGQSGTESGRCIYENDVGRRFRADCPPDYRP